MVREIAYRELVPDAVESLQDLETAIEAADVDEYLLELLRLRASQINGCAFCVDMHTNQARKLGVDNRRIAAVAAWRESPFFNDRERAAFQLTESITRLSEGPPAEDVYETAYEQFNDTELSNLVMAIIAINCWNRLWVSFRTPEIAELTTD